MLGSKTAASAIAFLGLSLGCAQAADISSDSTISYKDIPGNYWVVTLGGYAGSVPEFPGSKKLSFDFRPSIDIHRDGDEEWLTLPNDAASVTLYHTANFRIGAAGDLLLDRNRSDDSALAGMHNIDYTLEFGAFAEYYPAPYLRTRVELLQGVTGAEGLAANFMADYVYRPDPNWLLTVGPRLQFVNNQYESAFFSISGAEAALSGLAPYNASGGIDTFGIDATARYYVSDHLSFRGFFEWDRLVGDGADSPLVKMRGSEDQYEFGAGAAYRFTYGR